MSFPALTVEQWAQLQRIEPSRGMVDYFPCEVGLKDGRTLDRVLVVPAAIVTAPWPAESRVLLADQVSVFRESPYRIPARLAKKAYDFGESGMGYIMFTLVLADGRRLPYVTGSGIIDFVNLPPEIRSEHIVDLIPSEGREEIHQRRSHPGVREADSYWCPYYEPSGMR